MIDVWVAIPGTGREGFGKHWSVSSVQGLLSYAALDLMSAYMLVLMCQQTGCLRMCACA